MPNSHHPFEKVTGGKGDRDIRTDPAKYRNSLFWKRSACCNAHVESDQGKLVRKACGKITSTK